MYWVYLINLHVQNRSIISILIYERKFRSWIYNSASPSPIVVHRNKIKRADSLLQTKGGGGEKQRSL